MKLIFRIISGTAIILFIVMCVWSAIFYYGILNEVNEETDDMLGHQSEQLIRQFLATGEMPVSTLVNSDRSVKLRNNVRYYDTLIYSSDQLEKEPARAVETIFENHNGEGYMLTISTPTFKKADLQENILISILILFTGILISSIVINWLVLKQYLNPLYKLLSWLDTNNITKENTKLALKSNSPEFKKLYDATNKNAERNRIMYNTQKEFIDNASHEMQTPIAVCRNRVEMLIQSEELTENQLTELGKIQNTLGYMVRLNKSLLFLSKIENGQFSNQERILLNEIVLTQLDDLTQLFESKKLHSSIQQNGEFILIIDRTLAIALISNLLRNAFIHSNQNGIIKITITNSTIEVSNSSLSEALPTQNIFSRFTKKGHNENSIGLGLSIVKSICNFYNLNCEYYFTDDLHHFKISKK